MKSGGKKGLILRTSNKNSENKEKHKINVGGGKQNVLTWQWVKKVAGVGK